MRQAAEPTRTGTPRLAVRALILHGNRLLLVNAFRAGLSDLWCAPGGGVERGASLPENLMREVMEECGLRVVVGAPVLVNEFHDPGSDFHQVEVFFRCRIEGSDGDAGPESPNATNLGPADAEPVDPGWTDPEGVVSVRRFFTREELASGLVRFKPDSLASVAWGGDLRYDPLERLVR